MKSFPALKSEDDVRSKVVLPWLKSKGFNLDQLSLEFSFRIRIGRAVVLVQRGSTASETAEQDSSSNEYSIRSPRADVLVRDSSGHNLLIIEVKATGEALDDYARDQGISYARALAEGNIAPIVVLTNGKVSQVFDTFTREQIKHDTPDLHLQCARGRFRVDTADITLRAEALEALISFSSTNLLTFCDAQARFRMRLLSSNDIDSDRKYIPKLYVDRLDAKSHLLTLLNEEKRRVILVIGRPQVGKTNFICHMVHELISKGQPCFFYPAISLRHSLLQEISEDLEWSFGSAPDNHGQLVRRIEQVAQRSGSRVVIFIDGWNEANIQLAKTIDAECQRLSSSQIQIVISLTNTAATRLLKGSGGNASYVADEAGVPSRSAVLIAMDPEVAARSAAWSCIFLSGYTEAERDDAYKIYSKAYSVRVSESHIRSFDPYTIGAAMRISKGGSLPDALDESKLIEHVLRSKIARAIGLEEQNALLCLRRLAQEMLENDAPTSVERLSHIWGFPLTEKISDGYFDSALLAIEADSLGMPSVDFYYGRERDFAIGYLAADWRGKAESKVDLSQEFADAMRTNAGTEALRWFLRQAAHLRLIRRRDNSFPHYADPKVRQILVSSLYEFAGSHPNDHEQLIQCAHNWVKNDRDSLVRIEAFRLFAFLAPDEDTFESIFRDESSLKEFVAAGLEIGEDHPLEADSVGDIIVQALRSLHWDTADQDDGTSEITDVLAALCNHHRHMVRKEANVCFALVSPFAYIDHIYELLTVSGYSNTAESNVELLSGINLAGQGISEAYYGDMCPGIFHSISDDSESQQHEYEKLLTLFDPIIKNFGTGPETEDFRSVLDHLREILKVSSSNRAFEFPSAYVDEHTLPLPFDDNL